MYSRVYVGGFELFYVPAVHDGSSPLCVHYNVRFGLTLLGVCLLEGVDPSDSVLEAAQAFHLMLCASRLALS